MKRLFAEWTRRHGAPPSNFLRCGIQFSRCGIRHSGHGAV